MNKTVHTWIALMKYTEYTIVTMGILTTYNRLLYALKQFIRPTCFTRWTFAICGLRLDRQLRYEGK